MTLTRLLRAGGTALMLGVLLCLIVDAFTFPFYKRCILLAFYGLLLVFASASIEHFKETNG